MRLKRLTIERRHPYHPGPLNGFSETHLHGERDAATARTLGAILAGLLLIAGCGDDPVDPDPGCRDAAPLTMGVSTDSILSPGDPVLDGSFINYYAVAPERPGVLVIEMAAEVPTSASRVAVDPFLYLWTDELGEPIAQGYDPTGQGPLLRVAELRAGVQPGCYRVGASGWPGAAEGAYTIRAELIPTP